MVSERSRRYAVALETPKRVSTCSGRTNRCRPANFKTSMSLCVRRSMPLPPPRILRSSILDCAVRLTSPQELLVRNQARYLRSAQKPETSRSSTQHLTLHPQGHGSLCHPRTDSLRKTETAESDSRETPPYPSREGGVSLDKGRGLRCWSGIARVILPPSRQLQSHVNLT